MTRKKTSISLALPLDSKPALNSNIVFANLLTLAFLLLGLVGILNHEMWRDELQAWMISRDSASIINLFKNLQYEGHPGLWHLCLYFLAKLTPDPVVMQLFSITLATISTYLFARFSPFTRLQKTLFIFSYFAFYEYAIISRSYGLGVLLTFSFCALFTSRYRKNILLLSIIIALLANTSLYGLAIAASLQLFLLLEKSSDDNVTSLPNNKLKLISLLIVSLGIGLALFQAFPPQDSTIPQDFVGNKRSEIGKLAAAISTVWRSYIPLPNIFIYEFWNTNIIDLSGHLVKVSIIFSIGLLVFSIKIVAQKISILAPYLFGVAGILTLNYLNFNLAIRHFGHLFILFIAYLWLSYFHRQSALSTRPNEAQSHQINRLRETVYSSIFTLILAVHCISGIYSFGRDLMHPFSSGEEASNFIRHHQMTDIAMVGSQDYVASTLSGLLNREIYYLESGEFGSFIKWNAYRTNVKSETIFERANTLLMQSNMTEVLLISSQLLSDYKPSLKVKHLASFDRSISKENFYLYLLQK
ncbi:hypothetical protein [Myxacorys almedinensis]|uniref:Uncharacterized protein n=1 Tax=Myxacorys almedinensis A TaxID=2690445 RepID=A0A8J7Z5I7_9CYAN|nr:hypothetical protein [Myxacorys almedinensis]NDJ16813.1 hypothetical protein [Myxacorys almedinensis A]